VPFGLAESRRINLDLHGYANQTRQIPNATPSQMGIAPNVIKSAFGL
jgi:hypothetical protein